MSFDEFHNRSPIEIVIHQVRLLEGNHSFRHGNVSPSLVVKGPSFWILYEWVNPDFGGEIIINDDE